MSIMTRQLRRKTSASSGTRPIDLKRSLILRIAIVAMACLALVSAFALFETHREEQSRAAATAELVARQLSLQLLRINAGLDLSNRFPDWEAVVGSAFTGGQCVRFFDERGDMKRGSCVGGPSADSPAPGWFSAVSGFLYSAGEGVKLPVTFKGRNYGSVVVSSDPGAVTARIWREVKHPLVLTFLTIAALSVFAYVAIARALAPTQEVIAGLNRLAGGDFSHRLPGFELAELQRISEVANQLASKIEGTLAERCELSKRLMNTQEDERRHLARELHDEFGQNLTAIAALAASIEKSAERACPDIGAEARILSQISMDMMKSLRGTLLRLRPADFDKLGLAENLKQLVDVWSASRRQTHFELSVPSEIALPDNAAIQIYRIAQEGLTNAAKHAEARTVRLSVEPVDLPESSGADTAGIRLTIEDDGAGRRPNGTLPGNGMGLLNMQERVAALGGSISFDDRPGAGLRVRVVVPVGSGEKGANGLARH
jgi:signal transduction histidine kinase